MGAAAQWQAGSWGVARRAGSLASSSPELLPNKNRPRDLVAPLLHFILKRAFPLHPSSFHLAFASGANACGPVNPPWGPGQTGLPGREQEADGQVHDLGTKCPGSLQRVPSSLPLPASAGDPQPGFTAHAVLRDLQMEAVMAAGPTLITGRCTCLTLSSCWHPAPSPFSPFRAPRLGAGVCQGPRFQPRLRAP